MPPPIPHAPSIPSPPLTLSLIKKPHLLLPLHHTPTLRPIRCSLLSTATEASHSAGTLISRPSPAEVSRTIMELSSTGTLSALTPDGWPLGIGARFVADAQGAPALCLTEHAGRFAVGARSTFHVLFEQSGARTPQSTLLGSLNKPEDKLLLKRICAKWEKKFGEQVDEDLVYVFCVDRVLQMGDLNEEAVWVTSSDYIDAEPDPLRNFAQNIVAEMSSRHIDDVRRLCKVYVDAEFQILDAKLVWVDRLGFDLYLYSEKGVFAARIPFPREVTDEKGVKSSFNSMSHLAWEIEKCFAVPDFEQVKCFRIR